MSFSVYREVTQDRIPKKIIKLFKKYKVAVPKLIHVGDKDFVGIYTFDNYLELQEGYLCDNGYNEMAIKQLIKNPNYHKEQYEKRRLEYEQHREDRYNELKNTTTIEKEEQSIKQLQEESDKYRKCETVGSNLQSSTEMGIAMKMLLHRMNSNFLKDYPKEMENQHNNNK